MKRVFLTGASEQRSNMFEALPGSTWTGRFGRVFGPSTSKEPWSMHDKITAVAVVTAETLAALMTNPLVVVLGVE